MKHRSLATRTTPRVLGNFTALLVLAMLFTITLSASAGAQDLLWARRAGSAAVMSTGNDVGQAIAVDGFGNSYVTGQFRETATFGSGQPNQTILTASGAQQEIFIAKYDADGFLQWAKKITTAQGEGNGIGIDAAGNVYVTGYFNLSGTFAPGEGNETTLTPVGGLDIFLAKYDTNGNFLWAKQAGSGFFDQAEALAVDAAGNSYVTGRFGDDATFGDGEPNETVLTAPGLAEDIFVAKYNSDGLLQWAKRAGGTGTDHGLGIGIDAAGNSYVTGIFNGSAMFPATFGSGEANQTALVAENFNSDLFVAKYNNNGLLQWAKRAGGLGADRGVAIAVDRGGSVHVTGGFSSRAFFARGETNETFIDASNAGEEVFIAKYNTNGVLRRVRAIGQGLGEDIAVDLLGNTYVTGATGFFVSKYNPNGALLWRTTPKEGAGNATGFGIALDQLGNVLAAGGFTSTVIFGPDEPNETTLVSAGLNDVFVAKFAEGEPLDFGALANADGQRVVPSGSETRGQARGPAFQNFNGAGALQTTQFALNADFSGVSSVRGNMDADADEELLIGGHELLGAARGPAYQLFDGGGSLLATRFVLNSDFIDLSFSPTNVEIGVNGVLVCGREEMGLARGPAYQLFHPTMGLVRTQFVLNSDFGVDFACLGANLDGVAGDEVVTFGREIAGAARGPALQAFNSNGSLRFTSFVLNDDFIETKFALADVASPGIIVYGRETAGAFRGPAFQTFNADGNLILTRFVLNDAFTDVQVFGANTDGNIAGDEIVTAGIESLGMGPRGPAMQVWDKAGNHLFTQFVLNEDFTEVKFHKIDINNDGVDEILVVGRETNFLARGPAFQLFSGNGTLLLTRFVLNADFTNLKFFAVDVNGDGDKEIGIGGIETFGAARGPAYQVFESNGNLLQTLFVLNGDF